MADAGMAAVTYGDPWDPANFQGPLISATQRQRVLGYIEKGKAEGARLVCGGGVPAHLPKGYYVEPTLFADVDPKATIAQEEIFGPVLVIMRLRGRRRRRPDRQRLHLRPVGGRHRGVGGAGPVRGPPHPGRHPDGERRHVQRPRRPLRRLPPVGPRTRERRRGLRGVPRDEGHGPTRRGPGVEPQG